MQLNRKALLKRELDIVQVDLGNDEFVYVKQMSGRDRDLFDKSLTKEIKNDKGEVERFERDLDGFRAKLAVVTVCDEKGELLLSPEDVETLNKNMGLRRLEKIADAASKLNKLGLAAKEELTKNSEAAQSGSSNSGSVKN